MSHEAAKTGATASQRPTGEGTVQYWTGMERFSFDPLSWLPLEIYLPHMHGIPSPRQTARR